MRRHRERDAPDPDQATDLEEHPVRAVDEEEFPKAPWHFKLLLFGTIGYLIYRFIWFIFWLNHHAWHG